MRAWLRPLTLGNMAATKQRSWRASQKTSGRRRNDRSWKSQPCFFVQHRQALEEIDERLQCAMVHTSGAVRCFCYTTENYYASSPNSHAHQNVLKVIKIRVFVLESSVVITRRSKSCHCVKATRCAGRRLSIAQCFNIKCVYALLCS